MKIEKKMFDEKKIREKKIKMTNDENEDLLSTKRILINSNKQ